MNVIRNSILSMIGTAAFAVMSLVAGIILARSLAPAGFGQYALLGSTIGLVSAVGSMGLGGALIYWINKLGMDVAAASTMMIRGSTALGCLAGVVCALILQYDMYFGALSATTVIAAGVFAMGQVVVAASRGVFMARMQVRSYVTVQLTPAAALLSIVAGAALSDNLTLELALIASAISQGLGVAVLCWLLRHDFQWDRRFRFSEMTPLLRYGGMLNLAYFLYMLGIEGGLLFLRVFSIQFDQLGYYRVAMRLASVVIMVSSAVMPLLFSKYSSLDDDALVRNVERTSRVFWVAIAGLVCVLELIAAPLVGILYGEQFVPAARVLQLVLVGIAALTLAGPMHQMFYSRGAPRIPVAIHCLNVSVMFVLMAAYVPEHAAIAAGLAFAISNIVALCMTYLVSGIKYRVQLRQCFIITSQDFRFIFTNLRPADQRASP